MRRRKRRRHARENPAGAKRRLLLVGGVVVVGAVAYYLYSRSQSAPAALPAAGGGGARLPAPRPAVTGPSPGAIQAYKDAVNTLDKYAAYIQANPPQTQAELDAAVAKRDELMAAVRSAAAAAGMTSNV